MQEQSMVIMDYYSCYKNAKTNLVGQNSALGTKYYLQDLHISFSILASKTS